MVARGTTLPIIAVCCALGVTGILRAQSAAGDGDDATATSTADDEVVVRGEGLGTLRAEIRRAEDAVFTRFNEINSDDEFDIDCRMEVPLGSHVPRRVCRANFWREAEVDIAAEAVQWLQGSAYAGPMPLDRGLQSYKGQLLHDEIRRLAAEDQEFRGALTRLGTAHVALAAETGAPTPTADSASREVLAGEEGLPYGAASVVEVRAGHDPWTYVLARRTFTLAQVYGEIRSIDVECEKRNARLEHEVGVEWTIPDDWGTCTVRIDAERRTTFALYEFE